MTKIAGKQTKTPRARNNPEEKEQFQLLSWLAFFPDIEPFLIHIPNGGQRNIREAYRLKRAGVRRGVSDLFLALPNAYYCGLWLELKALQKNGYYNKPTTEQLQWMKLMKDAGYEAVIVYGCEHAKIQIIQYVSSSELYSHVFGGS